MRKSKKEVDEVVSHDNPERAKKSIEAIDRYLEGRRKRYARMNEAAKHYSVGLKTMREWARDAGAVVHVRKIVLVDLDKMDEFIDLFRDE